MKRCSHCKVEQPEDQFYASHRSANGLQAWCISCHKSRPNKGKTVDFECEKCHQIHQRVQFSKYKEPLRRKICCRCVRLEMLEKTGGKPTNYKGTKYFQGKTISAWKLSAKRRKHIWDVSNEELDKIFESQNGICALSGLKMIWAGKSLYRPSIDRKDSTKGYYYDNIQFVCSVVNIMKNKLDEEEFISVCTSVSNYNNE